MMVCAFKPYQLPSTASSGVSSASAMPTSISSASRMLVSRFIIGHSFSIGTSRNIVVGLSGTSLNRSVAYRLPSAVWKNVRS